MFGNLWGWLISLILVAAAIGGIALAEKRDRATPPSGFAKDLSLFAPLDFPIPPRSIMPELNGASENQPLVRRAVEAYLADRTTYDFAANGNIPKGFDALPGVAAIVDVAMSRDVKLLTPFAEKVVTFRANRPELDAMRVLGESLVRAALAREQSDPAAAISYYNAALTLGAKMFYERLVYIEASAGLTLMSEASLRLAKLARDPKRADALKNFDPARRQLVDDRMIPIWRVVGSVDPATAARHAGDLPIIARDSRERLWRVEAIFALGRQQFSAPRYRDRIAAQRVLDDLAENDADPIVRQAATAARRMTIQDFRMLH